MIFGLFKKKRCPAKAIKKVIQPIYNLNQLMCLVNEEYFESQLIIEHIAWVGNPTRQNKRSIILGRYCPKKNTIYIHRKLDSRLVPEFVIKFVIFHEMLHRKHPVYKKNGRHVIHSPAFKQDERTYKHYLDAKQWINKHLKELLNGELYGRT